MNSARFLRCVIGAVLLAGLLMGTSTAAAKPIVYPVKVTIKIKTVPELPPDSPWRNVEGIEAYPVVVLYGRITSPKRACVRKREIIRVYQPDWAHAPEEDKHTGIVSDGAGNWEGEAVPDTSLTESIRSGKERLWAKVARKRIGKGRFCAEAKSARLKV
jgi:hypothetical protein